MSCTSSAIIIPGSLDSPPILELPRLLIRLYAARQPRPRRRGPRRARRRRPAPCGLHHGLQIPAPTQQLCQLARPLVRIPKEEGVPVLRIEIEAVAAADPRDDLVAGLLADALPVDEEARGLGADAVWCGGGGWLLEGV
jgi:hypothetical protein